MSVRTAAFTFVALLPLAAAAQTSAPIDPLAAIEQYESDGQNVVQQTGATNSTASGYYQIQVSTWNSVIAPGTGLPTIGPGTDNPDGVMDLSAAQQQAGAAYLYQQQGFAPWTCSGCNAQLAAYVQSQGGASAFALTGAEQALLIDPVDATAGTTALAQGGLPAGGIASAAAAAGVTGATASGSTFNPFSFIYSLYQSAIQQPLNDVLGQIQTVIRGPLQSFLALSVMVFAVGMMTGRVYYQDMLNRFIRIAAVVGLTGVGSVLYATYVVAPFTNLSGWFAQSILGSTSTNPAGGFDGALHGFWENIPNVNWSIMGGMQPSLQSALLIGVAVLIVVAGLIAMFLVWFVAQLLTALLLALGPIFVLGLLTDYLHGWFDRWLSALMMLGSVTITADMLVSLVIKVIDQALVGLPQSNQATQGALNLLGIAIVVGVLTSAVAIMPRVLQHIAAAAGAPAMNHAERMLSAATQRFKQGAGTAVGGAPSAAKSA